MKKSDDVLSNGKFQGFGIVFILVLYAVSLIMVTRNSADTGTLATVSDVKILTFAHWQLEDGFREGYEEAIRRFEELKARQGVKVKVNQMTVPFRGYPQWFVTQFLGGSPADVIQLAGNGPFRNQHFEPLSPYIGNPNPFNKGTKFENVPWKDTFIDGMVNFMDPMFGEYFGIGTSSWLMRVYVNMDLLEKATGKRVLPETLDQWLAMCEQLQQYAEREGRPIIPIGANGINKGTVEFFWRYYIDQMNCYLIENLSTICSPKPDSFEAIKLLLEDNFTSERFYAVADILKELGKYFGEGFVAIDKEQNKYMFFSGNVCFYPEGSWDANSVVNNSPFEVKVIEVPVIGKGGRYGKYFHGRPTETGNELYGGFGIPKACKNFDLALEFLQFITSWEINQLVMVDYCKWPPIVKDSEPKGILVDFVPNPGCGLPGSANGGVNPFLSTWGSSRFKIYEAIEDIIITQPENAQEVFREKYHKIIPLVINETSEALASSRRGLFFLEAQRSSLALTKLIKNMTGVERKRYDFKTRINSEFIATRINKLEDIKKQLSVLEKFETQQ